MKYVILHLLCWGFCLFVWWLSGSEFERSPEMASWVVLSFLFSFIPVIVVYNINEG